MKKHILTLLTLVGMVMAPMIVASQPANAGSPKLFIGVTGDNGYVGMTSDGEVHYTLTNDGFRYYAHPSYGHCKKHHRSHNCRYVAPPKHKKYHKEKPHHNKKHHHDKHHHGHR